ncbi:MAG: ISC system 2Fe-2S type ferredoxin [Burkholderiaceae bacterium]|jgi:ferredoxin, 2Fe-2S|nr:ISC system 2Fe-2S type ferredoxin [Burkholderiaceae bacterium]
MPQIRVLPHVEICPDGAVFDVAEGENLCRSLLANGIDIEHACEMSKACTTCHVIVRKGFDSLTPSEEDEDDLLDRAWGLSAQSRLSCQVAVADEALEVEIPRYTINHARE